MHKTVFICIYNQVIQAWTTDAETDGNLEVIRLLTFRKYTDTASQMMDMKPNKLYLFCRHTDHSAWVYQHYYRLPSHTLDKLSKLLLAVENGQLNAFCGKNLDKLDIHEIAIANPQPKIS